MGSIYLSTKIIICPKDARETEARKAFQVTSRKELKLSFGWNYWVSIVIYIFTYLSSYTSHLFDIGHLDPIAVVPKQQ